MCRARAATVRPAPLLAAPLLAVLVLVVLPGCGVGGAVRGLFEPAARGEVDAHVVYRLRPDCPTLLARTTEHGYTVMTPVERTAAVTPTAFAGGEFVETGLFEGPVREGQSVFRYIPPAESETWDAGGEDVVVDVNAVELDLQAGHARVVALCGPLPAAVVGDEVPRVPGDQ